MACLAFTPNCFWNCDGDIPVTFLNWDIKLDKLGNPTSPLIVEIFILFSSNSFRELKLTCRTFTHLKGTVQWAVVSLLGKHEHNQFLEYIHHHPKKILVPFNHDLPSPTTPSTLRAKSLVSDSL